MQITVCKHCKGRVLPMADGSCPSCLRPLEDSEVVETTNAEVAATPPAVSQKSYGGIPRSAYFFGMLGLGVVNLGVVAVGQADPGGALLAFIVIIVLIVPSFVLVVKRLQNIGMSGWWSLLILVPIANLFVGLRCVMCPEGYQDTKQLDTAGKVIGGTFIGVLVTILLVVIIASLAR